MVIDRISLILVIVGALNWGAIGLFGFDFVAWLCGGQAAVVSRIVYTLVALAGIWCISLLFRPRGPTREQHAAFRSEGRVLFISALSARHGGCRAALSRRFSAERRGNRPGRRSRAGR